MITLKRNFYICRNDVHIGTLYFHEDKLVYQSVPGDQLTPDEMLTIAAIMKNPSGYAGQVHVDSGVPVGLAEVFRSPVIDSIHFEGMGAISYIRMELSTGYNVNITTLGGTAITVEER